MLMLPPSTRVFVATAATDLRKSFDGLSNAVLQVGMDPTSGHLYVFRNRRGDQVRVLFWDRTGYCVVAKRLARGRFHLGLATDAPVTHAEIDAAELALILEGIDLSGAKRHKRYRLPASSEEASRHRVP